jgi:membrane protease YdiL (CAAX protease family)
MNFIQQAYKGKTDGWRFIAGILLTIIGWQVIGVIPIMISAVIIAPNEAAYQTTLSNIVQGKNIDANFYLFLMLASFAFGLLFLLKGVKWLHKRSIRSLVTSRKKFDWKRAFFSFGLWFFIVISLLTIDYMLNPDNYVWNFKMEPFLILVLISFLLLPIQTSFEEIFFRGYLLQNIGIFFRNRWLPLVFTSVVFGLLHALNPETEKLGYIIMIYYIGTGLLFGITTLMDEGLELSLGMHAANNIATAIFVTTNWTVFQTDALFIDKSEPNLILEMFVPVFVIYPILLFIFSKKYRWKNWKDQLLGTIEKPTIQPVDKSLFPSQRD